MRRFSVFQDFLLGNHLLLIGNQGVGKNKIADRLLQLMNRPREYIQLHRDTTVQTLTLQPNIINGVVVYEDSPLVKAVKLGHILVNSSAPHS
jgi:von Willebrand factor A domain-containing protein 8